MLAIFVATLIARLIDSYLVPVSITVGSPRVSLPFEGLVVLGNVVPTFSVGGRRLHDTDRSGWWVLLAIPSTLFVAAVNILSELGGSVVNGALTEPSTWLNQIVTGSLIPAIIVIYWWALPGSPGPNRFGPPPKGAAPRVRVTALPRTRSSRAK